MNKNEVFAFILMLIILAVTIFFVQKHAGNSDTESSSSPPTNKDKEAEIYWGVDSASYTDESLYVCVRDEFGKPAIWGRYLGTIEGVSEGLDADEVEFLHKQNAHILIIYNHFSDATGYDQGVDEANKAIALAEDLRVPDGVGIFGDIEPKYPVNTDFIEGWYDTLADSKYEPALYGVFNKDSELRTAFEKTKDKIQEKMVVWTAYPQEGITTKDDKPKFEGVGPKESKLYGWQYGQDADKCNIDTNLFKGKIIDFLWKAD